MGFDGLANTRNHYGDRTAFLARMAVRYEDGREEIFVTDTSWTGEDAPVILRKSMMEKFTMPEKRFRDGLNREVMGETGEQFQQLIMT